MALHGELPHQRKKIREITWILLQKFSTLTSGYKANLCGLYPPLIYLWSVFSQVSYSHPHCNFIQRIKFSYESRNARVVHCLNWLENACCSMLRLLAFIGFWSLATKLVMKRLLPKSQAQRAEPHEKKWIVNHQVKGQQILDGIVMTTSNGKMNGKRHGIVRHQQWVESVSGLFDQHQNIKTK